MNIQNYLATSGVEVPLAMRMFVARLATQIEIRVDTERYLPPWANGSYSWEDDIIRVKEHDAKRDDLFFYNVLVHEIAHASGHTKRADRYSTFNAHYAPREREEVVAQSIAQKLFEHFGIGEVMKKVSDFYIKDQLMCNPWAVLDSFECDADVEKGFKYLLELEEEIRLEKEAA